MKFSWFYPLMKSCHPCKFHPLLKSNWKSRRGISSCPWNKRGTVNKWIQMGMKQPAELPTNCGNWDEIHQSTNQSNKVTKELPRPCGITRGLNSWHRPEKFQRAGCSFTHHKGQISPYLKWTLSFLLRYSTSHVGLAAPGPVRIGLLTIVTSPWCQLSHIIDFNLVKCLLNISPCDAIKDCSILRFLESCFWGHLYFWNTSG